MRTRVREGWRRAAWTPLLLVGLGAAGCDDFDDDPFGPGSGFDGSEPENVLAEGVWRLEGWSGTRPVGGPAVQVSWELPRDWEGDPFRVYARRSGQGGYGLAATVTSCASGVCEYLDRNVRAGESYDYYVTAVDERSGRESDASNRATADVPRSATVATPAAPRVTALDGALYLRWESTGAERYLVFLEREGNDSVFVQVGETDGTGYLDERAENGTTYQYRIAAVDETGQVSTRSALARGTPRPDYQAELVYEMADSMQASGFRFVASDTLNPVVSGNAAEAHWRIARVNGDLSLVPLGATTVTTGVLTTGLTCGPGSDAECSAIESATDRDAPTDFASRPVALDQEMTYLLRVRGSDGRTRYAKVRVQILGTDQRGKDLVIFDWAYQLLADEPSLNRR